MVGVGIMKVLASLQTRKWADEDIVEDIAFLNAALQALTRPRTPFVLCTLPGPQPLP